MVLLPGPHHTPSTPLWFPHQHQHSYQTDSIEVGLLTTLLSLSILGIGGAGWIPLEPDCTPDTVSQMSVLYLTTTSDPLYRLSGLS